MHDRDLGGEIGEEQRLLDRGIAAADHDHFLAAIEEAVAGGAGRHAEALELLLERQTEPARLRAGREDHGVGEIDVAGIAGQPERARGGVEIVDVVGDDPGADMLGLLLHLLHQPGPLDDVGEARIILDVGGDGELAAGLVALDQHRLQHGAGGIDGGRVAGRARPDNDNLGVGSLAHGSSREFSGWQVLRRALSREPRPVAVPNLCICWSHARFATRHAAVLPGISNANRFREPRPRNFISRPPRMRLKSGKAASRPGFRPGQAFSASCPGGPPIHAGPARCHRLENPVGTPE